MSTQCKAILVDGAGDASKLKIGTIDKPVAGPGELLVRVKAAGVNRMDIIQREGKYPVPPNTTPILGVELAGIVEAVGEGAGKVHPVGSRVFALVYGGAYAEYCVVPEKLAMELPAEMSFTTAAAVPEAWFTAYQALETIGGLKKGDSALIHAGGSGVGIAAIQLAREFGAKDIIVTAGSAGKLGVCKRLGATLGVNYKEERFADVIEKTLGGRGVNVLVDFIGATYWEDNLRSLGMDGRMVLLAFMSGVEVAKANIGPILRKRLRIEGSTLRSRSPDYQRKLVDAFEREVLPGMRAGKYEVIIDSTYPWERVREAHEHMEASGNTGKIVLVMEE